MYINIIQRNSILSNPLNLYIDRYHLMFTNLINIFSYLTSFPEAMASAALPVAATGAAATAGAAPPNPPMAP
jgi:hypothetical protein